MFITKPGVCRGASALLLLASPLFGQFVPGRYTLLLEDPPVSSRFAQREAMISAPAAAYRQQIERRQAAIIADLRARNIQVDGSVSLLINAVFVTAAPDRVAEVRGIPGVAGVRPMRRFTPTLNKATELMNGPAAWTALGGVGKAGQGIKIAVLDSGIDQTHPAFQDPGLTIPSGYPKCTTGHPEDCAWTNNKVIVARSYVRRLATAYVTDPQNPAAQSIPDDYSPRDHFGHGTAVASAAAGNTNTGTVTFQGMAPKAYLGSYKIAGSPGVSDGPTDAVMIQAIQDAVSDGMDIATLSWGGPALTGALASGADCGNTGTAPCDPVAAAYEAAARAGLVITVAAGNSGSTAYYNGGEYPYFNSISSPATAPSVIAVGASTNSHVMTPAVSVNGTAAPVALKGMAAVASDSYSFPSYFGANAAPLVDVAQLGNDGLACTALPAGSLTGAFALIQRGTCSFASKATAAQTAGAAGVVYYMADSSAPIGVVGLDCSVGSCFVGPAVMISNSDGVALKKYLASNPGQVVTIDSAGAEVDIVTFASANGISPAGANQLASYSSFGPAPDGAIKPDLVAVGGFDDTLSYASGLYMAAQRYDPEGILYSSNGYAAADGTSFAAPIVAGAAALVKQAHPNYTAAQIRSALVNYTVQDIATDTYGTAVDVEWLGAGRLDVGAAVAATVTAEPPVLSFGYLKAGSLNVSKTVTVTNRGSNSVTLTTGVTANSSVTGATVAVDKQSLILAAGGSATMNVTLTGTTPSAGSYSGAVTLKATGVSLHLPYMFLVGDGMAYNANLVMGSIQGTPGQDGGTVAVQVLDAYGVPVAGSPVSFSVSPRGSLTFQSVAGEPVCSPAPSTTSTVCNTDNFGFAYVQAILGSQTGSPVITAASRPAALSFTAGAYIVAQPAIDPAGVKDAAGFQSPVAPGSYAAITGSNLVDADLLTDSSGDLAGFPILPLSLDAVSVSFDVPSAGISVPARMVFASSGQLNIQVPWELQGQSSAQVKVILDEYFGNPIFSNVVAVSLADYAPAFFEGGGVVAARDLQGVQIFTNHPAVRGQAISLYANGLGPVTNQPATGEPAPSSPLAETKSTPVVMIGGQQAQVLFSGLVPGYAGEYQINVVVPSGLSAGSQPVTVAIGGRTSKASNLPVQ